ncbi:MAG: flavodoxin family protein [Cellulosilyticaceae bacterium]
MAQEKSKCGKKLVVFYSLEGHTQLVGQLIARALGATIVELKTQKPFPKQGFKKYFMGGKSVCFKEKPALTNKLPQLTQYDTVIIGTPVWAGQFSSPIRTFLTQNDLTGKKVAFFACHGGGGAKKCFEKLRKALPGCEVISEIDFVMPVADQKKQLKTQVETWVNENINMK